MRGGELSMREKAEHERKLSMGVGWHGRESQAQGRSKHAREAAKHDRELCTRES